MVLIPGEWKSTENYFLHSQRFDILYIMMKSYFKVT